MTFWASRMNVAICAPFTVTIFPNRASGRLLIINSLSAMSGTTQCRACHLHQLSPSQPGLGLYSDGNGSYVFPDGQCTYPSPKSLTCLPELRCSGDSESLYARDTRLVPMLPEL